MGRFPMVNSQLSMKSCKSFEPNFAFLAGMHSDIEFLVIFGNSVYIYKQFHFATQFTIFPSKHNNLRSTLDRSFPVLSVAVHFYLQH